MKIIPYTVHATPDTCEWSICASVLCNGRHQKKIIVLSSVLSLFSKSKHTAIFVEDQFLCLLHENFCECILSTCLSELAANRGLNLSLLEPHLRVQVGKIPGLPMVLRERDKLKIVVHQDMSQNRFDEVPCKKSPGTYSIGHRK